MKPTKEQVEAYKSMAKQSPMSMESMIKAHLVANCPKFIESKLDGCLKYLTACAREILDSKSGEVADDVCYKICRDYFNDEVWKQEMECSYNPLQGCMVKVDGKWLDYDRLRVME